MSFIPTRPPTTYVNKRLVDYWWCSLPAVCKTKLSAFASMLPHCAVTWGLNSHQMKRKIIFQAKLISRLRLPQGCFFPKSFLDAYLEKIQNSNKKTPGFKTFLLQVACSPLQCNTREEGSLDQLFQYITFDPLNWARFVGKKKSWEDLETPRIPVAQASGGHRKKGHLWRKRWSLNGLQAVQFGWFVDLYW